jgi:hypothetical protein
MGARRVDPQAAAVKKRWWAIVALAVVLAAAIGVTLYLKRPKPGPTGPVGSRIELSAREEPSLVTVRLLDRQEGPLEMLRKDGAWTATGAPAVTLDSAAAGELAYHFWSLTAEMTVDENPSDLAQYGLMPPRALAEGLFSDGSSLVLLLGDPTPTKDGYYLQVRGDPKVYTVWSVVGEHLHWRLADLRDRTISPSIRAEEVTSLLIRRPGGVVEIAEKSPGEAKSSPYGPGRYKLVRPYRTPRSADGQKLQELFAAVLAVDIADFVDDNPKDLAAYGLARPWAEVAVRDRQSALGLRFGAEAGSGKRYLRVDGRPGVCTVDTAKLAFLDTPAFALAEKFVLIPNIDDVDRIEITAAGATHTLAITRASVPPAAEVEEPKPVESFTADGKPVAEDSFRRFYQRLIGIVIEGETRAAPGSVPEVRTRFILGTHAAAAGAPPSVEAAYIPSDRDFYAVSVAGATEFAVSRLQVQAMRAALERLLAGEALAD